MDQVNHFQRVENIIISPHPVTHQGTEMLSNEPSTWEADSCNLYQKLHLLLTTFCQPYRFWAMKYIVDVRG